MAQRTSPRVAARRCGHRVSIWSSTGPRPHRGCSCSARCWRSPGGGSSRSPPIRRASTTLALIAEAFGAIGGVPARVLADRMACLKGGVVANVVDPDRRIRPAGRALRLRPGLLPRQRIPQSKGIVENLCGYAQRDLAVPLLTEAAIAGVAVDLRSANAAAKAWCAEVNAAMHAEIHADSRRAADRRT